MQKVELPGSPSSYHIINGFQEAKGGAVTVTIAMLRGERNKLEAVFTNIMGGRQGESTLGKRTLGRHVGRGCQGSKIQAFSSLR